MKYIADLHIHSHFSIATSKQCDPLHLRIEAALKGIDLVGTGDFTHPGWRAELDECMEPDPESGLLRLKPELEKKARESLPAALRDFTVRFVPSGEISSIYKRHGRTRKVHNLVLMPGLESAGRLSDALDRIGNIRSDGRPILGLDSRDLLEMCLEADSDVCFIPAHIWTPHFSVFGSRSGFDRIEDCYDDLTGHIHALETGLSSDPPMNWLVSALDRFTLVSNSDAHSPAKLAREANLLDSEFTWEGLAGALRGSPGACLEGTLEFYPEEGKYHFDGHRNCGVRLTPEQSIELGGRCPVCGGKLTMGVLNRVSVLADRDSGDIPGEVRKPYERLIPLTELLAECLDTGPGTKRVRKELDRLLSTVGSELHVLREAPLERISRVGGSLVAEAVRRNRSGEVRIEPGFDGQYGTVSIFEPGERGAGGGQMFFFSDREAGMAESPPTGEQPAPDTPKPAATSTAAGAMAQPAEDEAAAEPEHFRVPGLEVELNSRQREAVTRLSGPVAVSAGPGTGKTRCLAARAAWLLRAQDVAPVNILAVTFTNRAARQMRERIEAFAGPGLAAGENPRVSTLHGYCLDFLGRALGRAPLVADETDRLGLIRRAVAGIGEKHLRPAELSEQISRARALGHTPEAFRGPEPVRRAYTAYRDLCRELGVLDYDDLILRAVELLRSDIRLQKAERSRTVHLLVDEFQDLNPVQYELVRLLAGTGGEGLFVIGDPFQSIYGFRGADGRVFDRLARDYPNVERIDLELGYRCCETINRASAAMLAAGAPSALAPRPVSRGGEPVRLVRAASETSEAIAIVREIGRLVGGTGMLSAHGDYRRPGEAGQPEDCLSFSDIAVVARTGAIIESLEHAFITEGIPCRLRGSRSLVEDPAVRGILSCLRLLVNPADDLRLLDTLALAGLDPDSGYFRKLRARAGDNGRPVLEELRKSLSREVPISEQSSPAAEFLLRFERLRRRREDSPGETVRLVIDEFAGEDDADSADKLSLLVTAATCCDSLEQFLSRLTVRSEADLERPGRNDRARGSEAVTLMTMHAAKGLEFRAVFICAAEEGIIPYTWRETDPHEERRLFYVAMTRASHRLYVTSSSRRTVRGQGRQAGWSQFVTDLPPEQTESLEHRIPARRGDRQLDLL